MRHRHIDRPTDAQLDELIRDRPPAIRDVYLAAHRLLRETVPGLNYTVDAVDAAIGYGARQFGYDGWGMAALQPHARWVTLAFTKGAALDDPERVFEGTGRTVRHLKLRSLDELAAKRGTIQRLLRAAAGLPE